VITGLRLERDCAQRLCIAAIERAADEDGRGDVAMMARFLIRTGLGDSAERANRREENDRLGNCSLAGLWLDEDTCTRLTTYISRAAKSFGLTRAGCARHLIRLGLGIPEATSLEREQTFATIAELRRGERG